MTDFPLTPGEAIVLATFLEEHAKLPHLVALVDRLRDWARANLTPAAEDLPDLVITITPDVSGFEADMLANAAKARRAADEVKG